VWTFKLAGIGTETKEELSVNVITDAAQSEFDAGEEFYESGDFRQAIVHFNRAVNRAPSFAAAHDGIGRAFAMEGGKSWMWAAQRFRQAIRLNPWSAEFHDHLAWLRATCPEPEHRHGLAAVAAATTACELSAWKNPQFLSTLAAAWAEAGDFAKAVKWQEAAVDLSKEEDRQNLTERLSLFKQSEPFRDKFSK
jgi:Tfp pilus assembly protein PilF